MNHQPSTATNSNLIGTTPAFRPWPRNGRTQQIDSENLCIARLILFCFGNATKKTQKATQGKMGIVRCKTFRWLGILGLDGVWRDAQHRALEVVEVVKEF